MATVVITVIDVDITEVSFPTLGTVALEPINPIVANLVAEARLTGTLIHVYLTVQPSPARHTNTGVDGLPVCAATIVLTGLADAFVHLLLTGDTMETLWALARIVVNAIYTATQIAIARHAVTFVQVDLTQYPWFGKERTLKNLPKCDNKIQNMTPIWILEMHFNGRP